jgi:NADH dehydrogenase
MTGHASTARGLVTIFGGSGFLGRHAVRALAKAGWRVRVAVRRPDLAHHLQPLGIVGQVHAVQANLRYPESIRAALVDADAAINCVGILAESGKQSFQAVQADGAAAIASACRDAGIARLTHVSAIGAAADSPAEYGRTKAAGEAAVRGLLPGAVILRPSIIFGPEDDFFNRFAAMARLSPVLPLIGGGTTRFQPVFVGDVAGAILAATNGEAAAGTFELGGPEVKTFRELLEQILTVIGRRRLLLPMPWQVARVLAAAMEMLPGSPLTLDQLAMLRRDNIVSEEAGKAHRTLAGLGIAPVAIGAIIPSYLWRFRKSGQFDTSRTA